ncbi:hypothetical protein FN846DRAFT_916649 [Sphaerosporella brunnea]|uniref:Uncharacterized protein n=1 Tax=Sphaerosporella brunnea TaxID=1250544 RepID=A0A5J5F775_9PEZI|nr:hypothetical protein FN846DRAFT_916649 [Sphaerosporella brunnea]
MKVRAQGELIENIPWNPSSAVVLLTSWLNLKSLDDWELHGINKNESTNSWDADDGQRDVEDAFRSEDEDEDAGKSERQAEDSAARQSEARTWVVKVEDNGSLQKALQPEKASAELPFATVFVHVENSMAAEVSLLIFCTGIGDDLIDRCIIRQLTKVCILEPLNKSRNLVLIKSRNLGLIKSRNLGLNKSRNLGTVRRRGPHNGWDIASTPAWSNQGASLGDAEQAQEPVHPEARGPDNALGAHFRLLRFLNRGWHWTTGLPIDRPVRLWARSEPVSNQRAFQIEARLDQAFWTEIQVPTSAGWAALYAGAHRAHQAPEASTILSTNTNTQSVSAYRKPTRDAEMRPPHEYVLGDHGIATA